MSFRPFFRLAALSKGLGQPAVRPHVLFRAALKPSSFVRKYSQQDTAAKINAMTSSPLVIEQAKNAPKGGKLKELARKYGAAGVLVYLGVGCVDLGAALLAIEFAGLDRVKQVEAGAADILNKTKVYIGITSEEEPKKVEEAKQADSENDNERPSFTSVFLLAYTIHKTLFLPLRLTITAAITPAVVRKLHALGWARYAPRLLGGTAVKKV